MSLPPTTLQRPVRDRLAGRARAISVFLMLAVASCSSADPAPPNAPPPPGAPSVDPAQAATYLPGDVDGDGEIDVLDGVKALQASTGALRLKSARSILGADLAAPFGRIDEADATAILLRVLRISPSERLPLPTRLIHPADGAEMDLIPAGPFRMGNGKKYNERPEHTVTLSAYYIDLNETTYGQYRRFVKSARYKPQGDWLLPHFSYDDRCPVASVTWDDSVAFAEWAGKRLPTEAQWEKAARGTDGRIYPWGNEFDSTLLNWYGNRPESALPVGSFPEGASPYGVLDMAGNIWEWTADLWDPVYYTYSPAVDPPGPSKGTYRVMRGGGWNTGDLGWETRSAFRFGCSPGSWGDVMGFRCIVPLDLPTERTLP